MKEFVGMVIKVYTSDITKRDAFNYLGPTEPFIDNDIYFTTNFNVNFYFQKDQVLKFELVMKNTTQVLETTLGKILGTKYQEIDLPFLFNFNDKTAITVRGLAVKDDTKNSYMTIDIIVDLSSQPYSDYYIVMSNTNNQYQPQKFWKSEEKSGKTFVFTASMVNLVDVSGGDYDQSILMDFYNIYAGKIGTINTSVNKLSESMINKTKIELENDKEELIGIIHVEFNIERVTKFIELIEYGLQIQMTIGIDYTASNLEPTNPQSLHYCLGKKPTQYESAIQSCGQIVSCYDYDQIFPVFGFGGITPKARETSHCFNVTLKPEAEIYGFNDIIRLYRESLLKVTLDGPTYFAPLIKQCIKVIKDKKSETSIYYVLLIVTDGCIHDYEETKNAICEGAHLPFSIIIIGVGNEDFSSMIQLDGDKIPLLDKSGNKIERDIVQFVKYNDFKHDPIELSEQVLTEIPQQIEQYFRLHKNFSGFNGKALTHTTSIARDIISKTNSVI